MDKPKLLVVEDDEDLIELIKLHLMLENLEVDYATTGASAIVMASKNNYDLIVLDILLPDIDGFSVCKEVRKFSTVPIIFLTALTSPFHKVQGFSFGADDYIAKPFDGHEFVARVKAHLRRKLEYSVIREKEKVCSYHGLFLDRDAHRCTYDDIELKLTPKEFMLLWTLAISPSKVHSMESLYEAVWGDRALEGEVNPVMVHIRRIRKKFESIGRDSVIKTIWGVGYQIDV